MQFPFADVRRFVGQPDTRLRFPDWKNSGGRDFVRHFGPMRDRFGTGTGVDWMADELAYCDARHAIRFRDWHEARLDAGFAAWGEREYVLRRLYVHPPVLARFEVGVAVRPRAVPLDGAAALGRVDEFLDTDTVVSLPSGKREANGAAKAEPLVRQGRSLSRLLLRATTPAKPPPAAPPGDWWVRDGNPVAVVEYGPDELVGPPEGARVVPPAETGGIPLAYTVTSVRGRTVTVWFLGGGPDDSGEVVEPVRRLRLCLLRLHLEFEALKLVLNSLGDRDEFHFAPSGEKELSKYLDEASRRLFTHKKYGANQAPLFAAMTAFNELVPEEKRGMVLNQLKSLDEHLRVRIEKLVRLHAPVGGAKLTKDAASGGVPLEDVYSAILGGYSGDELTRLIRFRFDRRLNDDVDTGRPMKDVVFKLISLAEREGWLADLIREAYLGNRKNQSLMAVYQKAGFSPAETAQRAGADGPAVRSAADAGEGDQGPT